jgi:hypothetical protein
MSECPHKQLKKQMVGEQIWYRCECGQKFRVEPWDGRVRVVEGAFELQDKLRDFFISCWGDPQAWPVNVRNFYNEIYALLVVQAVEGLKVEEEARKPWAYALGFVDGGMVDGENVIFSESVDAEDEAMERNENKKDNDSEIEAVPLYRAAQHLKREQEPAPRCDFELAGERCVLNKGHANDGQLQAAAQPPQELVSLALSWAHEDVHWTYGSQPETCGGRNCRRCELEAALTRGAVGR